ncbi:hypothetical protein BKA93DRAFT_358857 [Sparassis latifolia]|uniref:Uncharacterized protein n=1 Tax=Sparassis crispa TaxID=139825 RepID=A0A401GMN7_9APHY|nr:hypothetical protein SCP_0505250 [Sparassis crispa]GBE83476.1 hypothetical protein SCP_0505250 [Sparassis crispa]
MTFSRSYSSGLDGSVSLVFDEFICIPEDDETSQINPASSETHQHARQNAMSLDFILTSTTAPHDPHGSDLHPASHSDVYGPSYNTTQPSFYAVREKEEPPVPIPAAISANHSHVLGWSPSDGRLYITLESSSAIYLPMPRETIAEVRLDGPARDHSLLHTAEQSIPTYARRSDDTCDDGLPMPRSSQLLYHPQQHNASPYVLGLVVGGFHHRSPSHSNTTAPPRARKMPCPPQQAPPLQAAPPRTARTERERHPGLPAPPAPRGGVSPALARTITHIRVARERAEYMAKVQSARGQSARVPSVMRQ